eukprot:3039536-Amphidinium_carterae.2
MRRWRNDLRKQCVCKNSSSASTSFQSVFSTWQPDWARSLEVVLPLLDLPGKVKCCINAGSRHSVDFQPVKMSVRACDGDVAVVLQQTRSNLANMLQLFAQDNDM